jgi:hypothetical protein
MKIITIEKAEKEAKRISEIVANTIFHIVSSGNNYEIRHSKNISLYDSIEFTFLNGKKI